MTTTSNRSTDEAPAVCWEPCGELRTERAGDEPGVCASCGWPADDHELTQAA